MIRLIVCIGMTALAVGFVGWVGYVFWLGLKSFFSKNRNKKH